MTNKDIDYRDTDVPVVLKDLPTSVRGFCVIGSDYLPIIVINTKMTREQQQRTYEHELHHIMSGEMHDSSYSEYGGAS